MFEHLGIIGWEEIEHIVLSALITDQPILFVGYHGCCKTDSALMLSKGLLGEDVAFAKYETPLVNTDDLLGYVNPKALSEGNVEYFGTGSSIWDVDACSFDEINRANPYTIAKIMELVRTRKIMSRQTKLKYVFSSANPPKEYDAIHLNLATASRFVTIRVPDTSTLTQSQLLTILKNDNRIDFDYFRSCYNQIKNITFSENDKNKLCNIVLRLIVELKQDNLVTIQPREIKAIYDLLLVTEAIEKVGIGININEISRANIVLSKIPQVFGITRRELSLQDIKAKIMQILVGFSLEDPITIAQNALDMFAMEDKNNTLWLAHTKDLIIRENDVSIIKQVGKEVIESIKNGNITDIMFNILMHAILSRYTLLCNDSYDDLLTWERDSMISYIKQIF